MVPELIKELLTWPVAIYIGTVLSTPFVPQLWRHLRKTRLTSERKQAGLEGPPLVDHAVKLATLKQQATWDALLVLIPLIGLPLVLVYCFDVDRTGLATTFLALFIWTLVSATNVAKAFLGGIAFRLFAGFHPPFQVGDRVTIGGHSGKVEEIGAFFVRLTTLDDDQVSIPTSSLWSAPIVSANAGGRASLCVMTFHLAPFIKAPQRTAAENAIWDAVQKSVYWEFDKPLQIYVEQRKDEIVLTAKAYVASTYNEPLFKSDVYQGFLDFASEKSIPLASSEWRRSSLPERKPYKGCGPRRSKR